MESPVSKDRLVWMRRDIERRFGFSGSRYTRVGSLLPAVLAAAMTVVFFGAMIVVGHNPWTDMFTERGWTPYVIVFFALWSLAILWLKKSKLKLQRRALNADLIPDEAGFVLSMETVDRIIQRLYEVCDDPRKFVLFHRIFVGLSSLRSLGRVVDLGENLRTQADHDESVMETSFTAIRGLVWAIPILGFVGTVSGLSYAIGGFGRVLSQTDDPSQLIEALKGVTGGLATAFETTLLALIAALLVQMLMTFQKKREEEFLDECTEYCQREVLSRLRFDAAVDHQRHAVDTLPPQHAAKMDAPASEPSPLAKRSLGKKAKATDGKRSAAKPDRRKTQVASPPPLAEAVEIVDEAKLVEDADAVDEVEVIDDVFVIDDSEFATE